MRAKMVVQTVDKYETSENIKMRAVYASKYPEDGSDENNTFAKFTPNADLSMSITNPNLLGKINVGDVFYVDFTKAN